MEIIEIVQNTGALSGILCLTMVLLAVKKQLKRLIL